MKVIGYVRVSTETQVTKGYGLEVQKQEIEEYCKSNNLDLVEIYSDEGISGKESDRPGLMDAIVTLEKTDVERIVVKKVDRLWRDDFNKVFVLKSLQDIDKDFISIDEPDYNIFNLLNDPASYLTNTILGALAVYERMIINKRLAAGKRAKAKKGKKPCGALPIGYKWVNAEAVIDEPWAEVVVKIFDLYRFYQNTGIVMKELAKEGILTPKGKEFSRQGIRNILKNDFYFGIVTYNGEKIQGTHEKIIGRYKWFTTQNALKRHSRNSKE